MLKSLGEVLGRLSSVALFILAARILGAQAFGRYSYAVSVASLALIGMDLGLNTLFVREGAKRPLEVPAFAGTLLLIKCLLATVMLGAVWLFC
ncbi:MAG: oligosaccharide flippase family protein, partial [Desulfarculaceae bacterium]